MKEIRKLVLLMFTVFIIQKSQSQFFGFDCSPKKFSGTAPAPWAIDGQVTDWQTLLGQQTNNIHFPFGNSLGANTSYDSYGNNDPDKPFPQSDIRVLSTIHDDYNVYFYLRRLHQGNIPNKAFYFLDTNLDGLINAGEPVICINFNRETVSHFSICKYTPESLDGDSIAIRCTRIDGYAMQGTITEDINSATAVLNPNEIFAASVTENGYGVELAVPWRYISQYKYFIYHLAMQRGTGTYSPADPSDNAGGCNGFIDIVGSPFMEVQNTSITTLTPGLSYRLTVTYKSLVPTSMLVTGIDFIRIKNIVSNNNLLVNEKDFSVYVNGIPLSYNSGTFQQQPIIYSAFGAGNNILPAFGISTLTIDVHLPSDFSVKSAEIEFTPHSVLSFFLECFQLTGGGGKPINPVGFSIETELVPFKTNNNSPGLIENGTERKFHIYPNPSKGSVTVILPETNGTVNVVLTDNLGRVIRKHSGISQQIFKIENLKPGIYLLHVHPGNRNKQLTKKIIVL